MDTISLTDAITLFDALLESLVPIIISVYLIGIAFKMFSLLL